MLPHQFTYLAILLNSMGSVSYIWAVLQGKAIPHPVTWGLWALMGLLIGAGQLAAGAFWPALITLIPVVFPVTVFFMSFHKGKAIWRVTKADYLCGILACMGLVTWHLSKNPFFAVFFGILADFFASMPSLVKAYRHPTTEDGRAYLICLVGWAISTGICEHLTFIESGFFIYNFILCSVFASFIYRAHINRVLGLSS